MKVPRLFLLLFGLLVLGAKVHATSAPADLESVQLDAKRLLERAMREEAGTGLQFAVMHRGRVIVSTALGAADLEGNVPLTPRHRLRLGSLSKPVTAMLALRLHVRGQLDLDGPVSHLVPEFPAEVGPITVRQIAGHASGIRQYDFNNFSEANNVRYYPELVDALELFRRDPLRFPPGRSVEYSSLAFNLLGVVVERAAGSGFSEVLRTELTTPLRLDTPLLDHPLQIIPWRARFYTVSSGEVINTFWRDSSDFYPSGGLLGTAEDYARFTDAALRDVFLPPAVQPLLRQPFRLANGTDGAFSFGWQVERASDGTVEWIGHGGENNGMHGSSRYYPDLDLVITGITNYNVYGAGCRVLRVLREDIVSLYRSALTAD